MMKKYNLVNNALGWLCFVIAAATYLLTIEPTASFWDCPEFIAQGTKLEVGHPPGNPIFMLTARFFVTIFGGSYTSAAVAVNSMSALLSAATILLLFWTITHLVRKIVVRDDAESISLPKMMVIMGAGLCGALAYTWSDTFWFSAVEGEVYGFSSFCTALVFWLILKWENRADEPHSDRYLVLIAYVIGVSIAVHLLNLLCIPAIVLVFYYRKFKNVNAKGSLIALGISFVLVAAILYGLVPGYIKVAQFFELFFVNSVGMSYNSGVLIYGVLVVAVFVWSIYMLYNSRNAALIKASVAAVIILSGLPFVTDSGLVWFLLVAALLVYLYGFCKVLPQRVFNVVVMSIFVIFIGYSSYALLLIRASANTPMNQNAPDNVFALSSYLNREQYGQRPLFYGPVFAETLDAYRDEYGRIQAVKVDKTGMPVTKPLSMSEAIYYERDDRGQLTVADHGKAGYAKVAKSDPNQPDKYVDELWTPDYQYSPSLNTIFTRIYSMDPSHVEGYKGWSGYVNEDLENLRMVPAEKRKQWADQGYAQYFEVSPYLKNLVGIDLYEGCSPAERLDVWKPSFADNLRYFLNYQLNHMYWRYFMWNFAGRQNDIQGNGEPNLGNWISGIPFIDNPRLGDQSLVPEEYTTGNKGHNVFYLMPLLLGIFGIIWQSLCRHRANPTRGIEQFWVVFFLFFMTGIAIVLYLNQTPGQPRERDYAFAGSFYAFAIWIGMGVPAICRAINVLASKAKAKKNAKAADDGDDDELIAPDKKVAYASAAVACIIGLIVPLQMVSQTWDDHDRSHRYAARDFGENYLNSLEKDAIIFTNGDNDTFPLWYAQEVEGVRTDVRVVNLSYLSTDWYANQMQHPYYDAKAINMLAKPTDYAYDNLAYSRVASQPLDTVMPALEGLAAFYKNPDAGMMTPRMVAPIDKQAMIQRFGINPNSPDSALVARLGDIKMNGLASSFSLSKLLSFDMIANSAANNFDRPIYFATTVPNSYYLGLDNNMYSSGLAQQVTPFSNAPYSPTATKAYENILSKFRWGGIDDTKHNRDIYLDETIRRMVSTHRNALYEVANELFKSGDQPATEFAIEWAKQNGKPVPVNRYDMARTLLNTMEEKLPEYVTRYESLTDVQTLGLYLRLYAETGNTDDLKRAEAILDTALKRYAAITHYAASMTPGRFAMLGNTDRYLLQYMPMLLGYKNYIEIQKKLTPEQRIEQAERLALAGKAMDVNNALNVFDYVFGDNDYAVEEFEDEAARSTGYSSELFSQTAAIMRLNEALGIDARKFADDVLVPYGSSLTEVQIFN